ncbi:YetF domain-containing protein [Halobacillus ihumii]|uniref:YetF domain-containing protein n=1 Tax=Halobacillus ihumii TaxID=2686092 RepID=UPI0013D74F51|nr:YetF domain-containing protein [Halobacillus ihumii]
MTPNTLGMKVEEEHSPTVVIMDGKLLEKGLLAFGYSKEWLLEEIKKQGVQDIEDVFLAQLDLKGNVYVDVYDGKAKSAVFPKNSALVDTLEKVQADLESYSKQTDSEARVQVINLQNTIRNVIPYIK